MMTFSKAQDYARAVQATGRAVLGFSAPGGWFGYLTETLELAVSAPDVYTDTAFYLNNFTSLQEVQDFVGGLFRALGSSAPALDFGKAVPDEEDCKGRFVDFKDLLNEMIEICNEEGFAVACETLA